VNHFTRRIIGLRFFVSYSSQDLNYFAWPQNPFPFLLSLQSKAVSFNLNFTLELLEAHGKSNRWDEFDQSTLYACLEISQWNHFVQLISASKQFSKKEEEEEKEEEEKKIMKKKKKKNNNIGMSGHTLGVLPRSSIRQLKWTFTVLR
jgi:hypothetical protein